MMFVKGEKNMDLGNKIVELRKKENLSQEELAEKIGVTRQTISKWELNETAPDIKQAKELSKIFKISLDELVNNDVKNLLVEKVSNTEKLAGLIIKIIKIIGIAFACLLIIDIIVLGLFIVFKSTPEVKNVESAKISCSIEEDDYLIEVGSDGYFNCSNCSKQIQKDLSNLVDYSDIDISLDNIAGYFANNHGGCE